MISQHLKPYKCFIACDRKFIDGKKPLNRTNDFNENLISYQDACTFIENGDNIGLVLGHGLIAIDCDNDLLVSAVRLSLPRTYEEVTTSKGVHFIFRYDGDCPNRNINHDDVHLGEIRTNRQYIVIAPSWAISKIDGKYHQYTIVDDIAPALITDAELVKLLERFENHDDTNNSSTKIELRTPKTTGVGKIDRSRYDFAKCCELIERGHRSFEEVSAKMLVYGSEKWKERGSPYQIMTYRNALNKIQRQETAYAST